MKATNITFYYEVPDENFDAFESLYAGRKTLGNTKKSDLDGIRMFVRWLYDEHYKGIEIFDNFFFSFEIPQISKEFDLLKLSKDYESVVNIELKSQPVDAAKIKKQLVRNKGYLSSVCKYTRLYSLNLAERIIYYLDDDNELIITDLKSLVDDIKKIEKPLTEGIERVFSASQFIISPISEPERFLNRFYSLNEQQEEIKLQIRSIIEERASDSNLIGVEGYCGTGKSLLLYDLARDVGKDYRVLVIHCAIMSSEHERLKIQNVDIRPVGSINRFTRFDKYGLVLVDEAHRLRSKDYTNICQQTQKNDVFCVMFYDDEQMLAKTEISRNISQHIKSSTGSVYKLAKKIRSSPELTAFIGWLFDLQKWNPKYDYDNVEIMFSKSSRNANAIKNFYVKTKGFTFLNYTRSFYDKTPFDYYVDDDSESTHRIIGREFKKVVCIIDDNFFYNEEGKLDAKSHATNNYLYVKMLYQNLTRAREKICIIVKGNEELFSKITKMLSKKYQ